MTIRMSNHSRHLAVGAILAAISITVAGCAAPEKTGGPVKLRMAVQTEVAAAFQTITDKYAGEHPDVSFQIDKVPVTKYGEVLRTQLLGGNAPDIFLVSGGSGLPESLIPFAKSGYLDPLTATSTAALISDSARPLFNLDGKIYGQPLDLQPWVNIVNDAAFAKAGLKPATDLDGILQNCAAASAAGKSLINLAGAAPTNLANAAVQIAASRVYAAEPDWNARRAAGDVTFAGDKGWKRTLQTIVALRDARCFQDGVEAGTPADIAKQVSSGSSVGFLSVGSTIGAIAGLNPAVTFSAEVFPGDDARETRMFLSPTSALAINAKASDATAAAAVTFLEWLAEPTNSDAYAALTGNISITATAHTKLPAHYAALAPFMADAALTQPVASAFWPNSEVYTALGTGVQGLLTGQLKAEQVLASMDTAWDR